MRNYIFPIDDKDYGGGEMVEDKNIASKGGNPSFAR